MAASELLTGRKRWWTGVAGVTACPRCGCPVQRTKTGAVSDGMAAHFKTVHKDD